MQKQSMKLHKGQEMLRLVSSEEMPANRFLKIQ